MQKFKSFFWKTADLLLQLDDRHAAVALAVLSDAEACHAAIGFQVAPQGVFERPRALSVNEPYGI